MALGAAPGLLPPKYAAAEEEFLEKYFTDHPRARSYFDWAVAEFLSPMEAESAARLSSPQAQKLACAYRNAAISFSESLSVCSEAFAARLQEMTDGHRSFRARVEALAKDSGW